MTFTPEQIRAAERRLHEAIACHEDARMFVNLLLAVQFFASPHTWTNTEYGLPDWISQVNGHELARAALSGKLYPQEAADAPR